MLKDKAYKKIISEKMILGGKAILKEKIFGRAPNVRIWVDTVTAKAMRVALEMFLHKKCISSDAFGGLF
jgi:hypothetical protein